MVVLTALLINVRWPGGIFLAINSAFALVGVFIQAPSLILLAALIAAHGIIGLFGSYLVHEFGHTIALKLTPGIQAIRIERTFLRFSMRPIGTLTGWHIARTACAGPLSAVTIGCGIAFIFPQLGLQYWYFFHALSLLPPFGDGNSLLFGLLRGPKTVELSHDVS